MKLNTLISFLISVLLSLGVYAGDDFSAIFIGGDLPVVGLAENISASDKAQKSSTSSNTMYVSGDIEVVISSTFSGRVFRKSNATSENNKTALYIVENTLFVGSGYFETVTVNAAYEEKAVQMSQPQHSNAMIAESKPTKAEISAETPQRQAPQSPSSPIPPAKDGTVQPNVMNNLQRQGQALSQLTNWHFQIIAKQAALISTRVKLKILRKLINAHHVKPNGLDAHFVISRPPPVG